MNTAYAAFTDRGMELARRMADELGGKPWRCGEGMSLDEWTRRQFDNADALVFVGAAGIAVRAAAPYLKSKSEDPAVVVVDEAGRFAVPILSGHLGGANELAGKIAHLLGGQCVLTTATDVRGVFAADTWAKQQGLLIRDLSGVKKVSAALLEGETVTFCSDVPISGKIPVGLEPGSEETCSIRISTRPSGSAALHLVPRCLVIGIGCRRGTPKEKIRRFFEEFMQRAGYLPEAVGLVCSIDLKKDESGILALAESLDVPFETYSAEALQAAQGEFSASDFVKEVTGTDNVCERSIVCAGGELLSGKEARDGITMALGERPCSLSWPGQPDKKSGPGTLFIVGLGPGDEQNMTGKALEAVRKADLICGYGVYVDQVKRLFPEKETFTTPMTRELERCRYAVEEAAKGRTVAMVCSGDAGIYGMAGPVLEMAAGRDDLTVKICPGITAAVSGAALIGAPLMNDFCVISLSDRLTKWEDIEKRLRAAAEGDLAICLYNPASKTRKDHLAAASRILLEKMDPETVCALVSSIGREGEAFRYTTLEKLGGEQADMFTTVFIGSSRTYLKNGFMITRRGYEEK